MKNSSSSPAGVSAEKTAASIFVCALMAAAIWIFGQKGISDLARGVFIDSDGYMHAIRTRLLLSGRQISFVSRDNAPYGFEMHWSSLYDLYVAGLVRMLRMVLSDIDAFRYGSGLSASLNLIGLVWLSAWAIAPRVQPRAIVLLGALLIACAGLMSYGAIGRDDHHILTLMPIVAALGCLVRRVDSDGKWGSAAGVFLGLGLWVSVECLPAVLFLMALAGLARTETGQGPRIQPVGGGLLAAIALSLAIDPPASPLSFWIDRDSLLYLLLGAFLCIACMAIDRDSSPAYRTRTVRAAATGVAALLAWIAIDPSMLSGPAEFLGPELVQRWWDNIGEIQPVTGRAILVMASPAIIGTAALSWRFAKDRSSATALHLAGMTGFLALNLAHLRFSTYGGLAGSIGIVWAFKDVPLLASNERPNLGWFVAVCLAMPAVVYGSAALGSRESGHQGVAVLSCSIPALAGALARTVGDGIVLSPINEAPEILYWTDRVRTVAGPYQRNPAGLHDTLAFFRAKDFSEGKSILSKRGIGWVLFCPRPPLKSFKSDDGVPNIYERLVERQTPGWLIETSWPAGLATDFRLYRVGP